MSTPARRAAIRDRWSTGSLLTRAAKALDWIAAISLTLAIALIGSLNL